MATAELSNGYTYVNPTSFTAFGIFTYEEPGTGAILTRLATEALSTSDPSANLSRLAVETLSTSDVAVYLSRLTIEVLSTNVEMRRRPKFFTYLID